MRTNPATTDLEHLDKADAEIHVGGITENQRSREQDSKW